jgi:hypothetical protein
MNVFPDRWLLRHVRPDRVLDVVDGDGAERQARPDSLPIELRMRLFREVPGGLEPTWLWLTRTGRRDRSRRGTRPSTVPTSAWTGRSVAEFKATTGRRGVTPKVQALQQQLADSHERIHQLEGHVTLLQNRIRTLAAVFTELTLEARASNVVTLPPETLLRDVNRTRAAPWRRARYVLWKVLDLVPTAPSRFVKGSGVASFSA